MAGRRWPDALQGDALQLLWRVEMGPSYSGPIVVGDRVFVTEAQKKTDEVVRALDKRTGKDLWKTSWPGVTRVPFFAASNGSWIRSTPVWDERSLYVGGMRDVLVSLDDESGQERWRVDFASRLKTPLPDFGFVSSPLIVGNDLYVQAGASFIKLDKRTGRIIWRSLKDEEGMWGGAFSSPVMATIGGVSQLVVQAQTVLAGVEAESGAVLWSQVIPAFRGMNILTPVVLGDRVFTIAYGGKSMVLQIRRQDGGFVAEQVWKTNAEGHMSTPIVIDGHAYLHLRSQRFTCIDLATGKACWTSKPFGQYWSMIVQGDRILALDQRGELLLIRATPDKFDLLDRREISDATTWAHVAMSGEGIFVRELEALAAYRCKSPGARA
ncbi:MAG: PQQ-binding-like beta-propeller repeat protein [Planctomycetota bacterium]|nr:PQQ-binding-like beta-propeller repeat protein [Planctomycetota bacterium]